MTREWLAAEIERIGLKEIGDDPWGGEHELILAALKSGPPHRDAPDYQGLCRAMVAALDAQSAELDRRGGGDPRHDAAPVAGG